MDGNKITLIKVDKQWNNIKKLFRENVELQVTDETPDASIYRIVYNDREVGQLGLGPVADMDMTMELAFIELRPDHQYQSMKIMTEVITALWETFRDTQRIILTPKTESRSFWHKMGANRLNDDFLMLSRGH